MYPVFWWYEIQWGAAILLLDSTLSLLLLKKILKLELRAVSGVPVSPEYATVPMSLTWRSVER